MSVWTVPAELIRVVDADTLRLTLDLGWHTYRVENCRLIGINAPEMSTPEGRTARDYAVKLLPVGTTGMFVSSKLDKYGRPLGRFLTHDMDYGEHLVAAGHAVRMGVT